LKLKRRQSRSNSRKKRLREKLSVRQRYRPNWKPSVSQMKSVSKKSTWNRLG